VSIHLAPERKTYAYGFTRRLSDPYVVERAVLIRYCSFAYSAPASLRMGMSGSASFQSARKS